MKAARDRPQLEFRTSFGSRPSTSSYKESGEKQEPVERKSSFFYTHIHPDPGVGFRNNANSGNLILTTDSSDNLLYNGHVISPSSAGTVTSITGTANQVIASSSTGNITLSLPQSVATASSPTFAGLTLSSPLSVANGGTGATSLTAYAVLCGGTTSTSLLQSVASVGTSGQVLTSNGPGALPTFTNATGTGTVNSGTTPNIAYYATSSSVLSDSGISRANLFLADGTVSATGAFNLNSHKITSVTQGTTTGDAISFPVAAAQIANNTITATQIANATITDTQIASNTLTGSTANSGGSAGNIAQGTISTPDLRSGSVTQVIISATGASADEATVITTANITTVGGKVLILARADFFTDGTSAGGQTWCVTRGGTSITGGQTNTTTPINNASSVNLAIVDSPSAGNYTYNFTRTTSAHVTISAYSLVLIELRA